MLGLGGIVLPVLRLLITCLWNKLKRNASPVCDRKAGHPFLFLSTLSTPGRDILVWEPIPECSCPPVVWPSPDRQKVLTPAWMGSHHAAYTTLCCSLQAGEQLTDIAPTRPVCFSHYHTLDLLELKKGMVDEAVSRRRRRGLLRSREL